MIWPQAAGLWWFPHFSQCCRRLDPTKRPPYARERLCACAAFGCACAGRAQHEYDRTGNHSCLSLCGSTVCWCEGQRCWAPAPWARVLPRTWRTRGFLRCCSIWFRPARVRATGWRNRHWQALGKAKPAAFYEASLASMITPGNFEDDLPKLKQCDWVIEAVAENLEIKRALLDRVVPHLVAAGGVDYQYVGPCRSRRSPRD